MIFRTVSMAQACRYGFQHVRAPQNAKSDDSKREPLLLASSHRRPDEVFFSSEESEYADWYISFVPGRAHALALRQHINLRAAVWGALLAFVCAVGVILSWLPTSFGGRQFDLTLAGLGLPCMVFLCVVLNDLPCSGGDRVWISTMCLHQSRTNLRARALSALPEFISSSERVVVLLSPMTLSHLRSWVEIGTCLHVHGLEQAAAAQREFEKALRSKRDRGGIYGSAADSRRRGSGPWHPMLPPAQPQGSPPAVPLPSAGALEFISLARGPWLLFNIALDGIACLCAPHLRPIVTACLHGRLAAAFAHMPLGDLAASVVINAATTFLVRVPLLVYNASSITSQLRDRDVIEQQ